MTAARGPRRGSGPAGIGTVIPPICACFTARPRPAISWCATCGWRWNLHADEKAARPAEPLRTPVVMRLDPSAPAEMVSLDAGNTIALGQAA